MINKLIRGAACLAIMLASFGFFATVKPSQAQCTPNNAPAGSTVTCTGTDSNGYYSGTNNLNVTVQTGATVVNPNDNSNAIRVQGGNTVTNNGTIAGNAGGDGLKTGGGNTITNNGTISSEHHDALDITDGNTVVNNGTISTGTETNPTDGDKAIDAGNNNNITNNGTIDGNGDGIYTGSGNTITNNGTIHSEFEDGIDAKDNVTVNNYGTISNTSGNEGVDIDHNGTVNNYGTIEAHCDGIDILKNGEVNNEEDAVIHSENCKAVDASAYTVVNNSGTISTDMVTGDTGVELDYGGVVNNTETGDIEGRCRAVRATSDATVNNEGEMYGAACDGVDIDGIGTVTNDGTITTNADAAVEVNSGTITNTGTLDGGATGIKVAGVDTNSTTIVNDGTIEGSVGINASYGAGSQTVVNNGTIIGEGGTAVRLGDGNDVMDNAAGAVVQGTMDGGAGTDILQFRYRFEATDFYIPDEYRAMEAQVMAAPTTGCPCTIELTVAGVLYRYRYTNFEQLQAFLEFVQLQVEAQTPDTTIYTGGNVSMYALTDNGAQNGSVAVYHTINGQGVHIATFNAWQAAGLTFTGADGWKAVVSAPVMEGTTQVLTVSIVDPAGAVQATTQLLLMDNGAVVWR